MKRCFEHLFMYLCFLMDFLLFMVSIFISNWFFSIKENNVKLTRDLKPLFVCLFVWFFFKLKKIYIYILLVSFSSFPLPVDTKRSHPLSDPFLKVYPHLCKLLLRHCICIIYRKHRIGRKAVKYLEI